MIYYLIHNGDETRKKHMIESFKRTNINLNDVIWVLHPNKDEINTEFILNNVIPDLSLTCGKPTYAQYQLNKGSMCCTYKHYLALKHIVENNHEYAVIMEDNMLLGDDIVEKINIYIKQLNELYPDWDIIFDNAWHPEPLKYFEGEIKDGLFVYPKSNKLDWEVTKSLGGTKCACFYLLNLKCAKKLYDNYIPYNNAPDWWMNDLFRKLNIKSFWAEPSCVFYWKHESTCF